VLAEHPLSGVAGIQGKGRREKRGERSGPGSRPLKKGGHDDLLLNKGTISRKRKGRRRMLQTGITIC